MQNWYKGVSNMSTLKVLSTKSGCITGHYLTQKLSQYMMQQNEFYNQALSDSVPAPNRIVFFAPYFYVLIRLFYFIFKSIFPFGAGQSPLRSHSVNMN
jgi:hypothetical protein